MRPLPPALTLIAIAAALALIAAGITAGFTARIVAGPDHPSPSASTPDGAPPAASPSEDTPPPASGPADGPADPPRILLVTATAGFHHDSISTAQAVVQQLGRQSGQFEVTLLSDVRSLPALNAEALARHRAVFFANTSGELPLDATQKQALLDFVAAGGGFVATHSASDTFYTWPAYGGLLGAYFHEHPWTTKVDVTVDTPQHPLTAGLGDSFAIFDEIYVFRTNPRATARVLLTLDGDSLGTGDDHPLAWCTHYGAGRVVYNALGHFDSTWQDERFQTFLLGAVRWATGQLEADCGAGGA
jgi:type 1 glutamine amidotransferase